MNFNTLIIKAIPAFILLTGVELAFMMKENRNFKGEILSSPGLVL